MTEPAWLISKDPDRPTERWFLDQPEMIIGRRPPAQIVLPFPQLSRRHAVIKRDEWGYTITDLGSRNGTFVDGQVIGSEPYPLVGGEEIVFGGAIALHFEDPDETAKGPRLGRLSGIWIDPDSRTVWVDAAPLEPPLSSAQFALLSLLYDAAETVVSREQMVAAIWPEATLESSEDALDGLIKRVRARLRQIQPNEEYIQVVRGHGLRLVQPNQDK